MNVAETILVFVGIPLGIVLVLALLTLPGGRKRLRYKPGQSWDYPPVWYEPHPEGGAGGHGEGHGDEHGPLAGSPGRAALPGGTTSALGSSVFPEEPDEHRAGSIGTTTATAAAPRPAAPAGPLGGARGTW